MREIWNGVLPMAESVRCGLCGAWVTAGNFHSCDKERFNALVCAVCNHPRYVERCKTCDERSREHPLIKAEIEHLRKLCGRQQEQLESRAEGRGESILSKPIKRGAPCPKCGEKAHPEYEFAYTAVDFATHVEGRSDVLRQRCAACKGEWLVRPIDWPGNEQVTAAEPFEIPGWKIERSRKRWRCFAIGLLVGNVGLELWRAIGPVAFGWGN